MLFTSYEQLGAVAERLRGKLPYTLLVQDQGSTSQLLQWFKEDVHSVLLATARFWEGIDIVGEALSLLIICRLPFDVPAHPLARARFEAAKARGENPFTTVAVPEAIIKLQQGVGRLIRSTSDRGVVAILDGRVSHQVLRAPVHKRGSRCPAAIFVRRGRGVPVACSGGGCVEMMAVLLPGTRLRVARVGEVVYTGPGTCGYGIVGCRQRILWARTANNRPIALNPDPNEYGYYIAHQATCPSRQRFETPRTR